MISEIITADGFLRVRPTASLLVSSEMELIIKEPVAADMRGIAAGTALTMATPEDETVIVLLTEKDNTEGIVKSKFSIPVVLKILLLPDLR